MRLHPLLWLIALWLALALAVAVVVSAPAALGSVRALLLVGLAPLVVASVVRSPRAVWTALADGCGDAPAERRRVSASVLASLGGTSFALGVVAGGAAFVASLNAIAASGDQASSARLVGALGGLLVGPLYGFALRSFLWGPLAARLADAADAGRS